MRRLLSDTYLLHKTSFSSLQFPLRVEPSPEVCKAVRTGSFFTAKSIGNASHAPKTRLNVHPALLVIILVSLRIKEPFIRLVLEVKEGIEV